MEHVKRSRYRILTAGSFLLALSIIGANSFGQGVPYHTDHEDLYAFLNDLRVNGCVDFNPAIRPMGRFQIAELLMKADSCASLNEVQRKTVQLFWREFGKDLENGFVGRKPRTYRSDYMSSKNLRKRYDTFYYSSNIFQITMNPIIGGELNISQSGQLQRYQWWGGEMFGRVGKNWGYYFNIRDHLENPEWHSDNFLSPRLGGVTRESQASTGAGGVEYYELRGGLTYSWKWGMLGLIKDHVQWGTTPFQEVILSKRAPSAPRIILKVAPVKWAELNYTFGFLSSGIVDSAQSYFAPSGAYREVFHSKFHVANMLTFRPVKGLRVGFGSSVIIADNNLNAAHFIPIMFYTALDQSFNGQVNKAGQNSQVYFDLSWDAFGYLQVYGTALIDEIRISKMFDSEDQRNIVSLSAGFRSRTISKWNLKVYGQYLVSRPGVYTHYIATTEYTHAGYGLGHFLGENAEQIIAGAEIQPLAKLRVKIEWEQWRKGERHVYDTSPVSLSGLHLLSPSLLTYRTYTATARYQIVNDIITFMRVQYSQAKSNGIYKVAGVDKFGDSSRFWFTFGLQVGI